MELEKRVIHCVCESLGLNADLGVNIDTKLIGSLPEFDSQSVLQIILALEDEFSIVVEDEDVSAEIFDSISSLCEFVNSKSEA